MVDQNKILASKELVVIGAGGHAACIAEVACSAGYQIKCFVDRSKVTEAFLGFPVIGAISELSDINAYLYCIAIGDNAARERVYREIKHAHLEIIFPSLVHKSAVISRNVVIGEGAVVMPNACIGPSARVGAFCVFGSNSSVDHDCVIDDFASVGMGVSTGGNVQIGFRSVLAIGAVVKHGVRIGKDTVLGANSYLNQSLGDGLVAYGSPAKVVRERKVGDRYL